MSKQFLGGYFSGLAQVGANGTTGGGKDIFLIRL
jgi:hypothetical protein